MHDYVIVGAGSAGCALADRLTEDGAARVLLLEAGPPDRRREIRVPAAFSGLFKTDIDWNYTTAPQKHLDSRALYWPRGKTLGGSSSINAQMYVRGNRLDYDGWAALGNPGWSHEEVLPYFKRAEHCTRGGSECRGEHGPLHVTDLRDPNPTTHAFVDAAARSGLRHSRTMNDGVQDGVDYTEVTQKNGQRCSAADAYLRRARGRPNLSVVTAAHATRLLLEGRRAVGVEYMADGRAREARAAREVIVSGGAVNSAQLLMLSGIGPADHLRDTGIAVLHDLPGVGLNLLDHLAVAVVVACPRPVTLVAARSIANLLRYLVLRRGMLTSNIAEAYAFTRTRSELPAPDLELIFAPVPFVDHGLVPPTSHGLTIGAILLQPRSTGRITLGSPDPLAPPVIDPRYLSDESGEDLRVLVDGVKLARRIFRTAPLEGWAGEELMPGRALDGDDALRGFVRAHAQTLYHPVGTCRMGRDPLAVVDPELRVHGIDGLRVVDASVMPTIPRGHTNASTIMIAERGADLIRAATVKVRGLATAARAMPTTVHRETTA